MEMENNHTVHKLKLEFFNIVKAALIIPCKNLNFIIFTLFTSLPFFCFIVFYENFLQTTLVETSKILSQPPPAFYHHYNNQPIPGYITKRLTREFVLKVIQLGLLYLVPLHLLDSFNAILTVELASKIYVLEKPITLREMINQHVDMTRLKGCLITSLHVLFLSTCTLLGLVWLVTNYNVISRTVSSSYQLFFVVFFGAAFVVLLVKYLEWSAVWNMSIVISVLERRYGAEALALSGFFIVGSKQRGLLLMLVFFAWGTVLRLQCLYAECNERGNGIVAQSGLYCLGNVVKWVACMVYFYDCKKRILEKKVDEEEGREVKVVDECVIYEKEKL